MSLTSTILKEFNSNQLRIGGDTPLEKLQKSVEKSKKKFLDPKNSKKITKDEAKTFLEDEQMLRDAFDSISDLESIETFAHSYIRLDEVIDYAIDEFGDDSIDWDLVGESHGKPFDENNLYNWLTNDYLSDTSMNIEDALYFIEEDFKYDVLKHFEYIGIMNESGEYISNVWGAINKSININGEDCMHVWRAVSLNMDAEHPLSINDGVGLYWSYDEGGAEAHGASEYGGSFVNVVLEAYVPLRNINWEQTIYKTLYGLRYEREIEVIDNRKIYLKRIIIENENIFNDLQMKAEFIMKTYFTKKSGDYKFKKKIYDHLVEKGLVKKDFNIVFQEYREISS